MTDLADFLLARIAKDEAAIPPEWASEDWGGSGFNAEQITFEVTPRRWLAECEAKRRIVEQLWLYVARPDPTSSDPSATQAVWIVRQLAAPYANHPDYDESWQP